ncbi:hypothetical protein GALL_485080 [mine drainage metagenome]|uniref:Uncharacterized protein n=1 Tax=mine drainage metagenome TaxID=410659 RepID=A0A1J5Q1Y9_9ZZZZ
MLCRPNECAPSYSAGLIAASQRPARAPKAKNFRELTCAMAMRLLRGLHLAKSTIDLATVEYRQPAGTGHHRLRRKGFRGRRDARQTGVAQTRRHGGVDDRSRFGQGVRARHRGIALRQRRTAAGEIPAEAPDDRRHQPAAGTRDAILRLQRRPGHAERCVLRPLSPGRYPLQHRPG